MFLPSSDWRTLNTLVETGDNTVNQCSASNPNGCFLSFMPKLSYAYVIMEERTSSTNALLTVSEGAYVNGEKNGIHRDNGSTLSDLITYKAGRKDGKQIQIFSNPYLCSKRVYSNNERGAVWTGTDLWVRSREGSRGPNDGTIRGKAISDQIKQRVFLFYVIN